jgi:hypothetical protein
MAHQHRPADVTAPGADQYDPVFRGRRLRVTKGGHVVASVSTLLHMRDMGPMSRMSGPGVSRFCQGNRGQTKDHHNVKAVLQEFSAHRWFPLESISLILLTNDTILAKLKLHQ